jgi:hypothetical protein
MTSLGVKKYLAKKVATSNTTRSLGSENAFRKAIGEAYVRANESAITIIALVLGVCLTLVMVFGNFSLAYLVKLFAEERVPVGNALFVWGVTAANLGVLGFLGKQWLKTIRKQRLESTPLPQPRQRQDSRQRWQGATEKVLELARTRGFFDVQHVMDATEFNRTESEYLLDELLNQDLLSVQQDADTFNYSLKDLAPQKLT